MRCPIPLRTAESRLGSSRSASGPRSTRSADAEPCGGFSRKGALRSAYPTRRRRRPVGAACWATFHGEATEKVERIRRGMSRLPAGYRAVLSLLLFEGYDYEEAAEITGLKASSVRSQYVRAKARLLEILKKDG
ncbi:MAG: RNA polymerase sigma factor [Alistipes ihumii]|uniref:RNA polymerase sigma factor n=1 Tax=Alistipes ihumii TaxID=1470347 RepID=UPI00399A1350